MHADVSLGKPSNHTVGSCSGRGQACQALSGHLLAALWWWAVEFIRLLGQPSSRERACSQHDRNMHTRQNTGSTQWSKNNVHSGAAQALPPPAQRPHPQHRDSVGELPRNTHGAAK